MRIYLIGISFLFFNGCTPQPEVNVVKCEDNFKHIVPYSLEFLNKRYECSREGVSL